MIEDGVDGRRDSSLDVLLLVRRLGPRINDYDVALFPQLMQLIRSDSTSIVGRRCGKWRRLSDRLLRKQRLVGITAQKGDGK